MAVMTVSQKTEPKGPEILTKKHIKYSHKTRPITATLEHPLILDIKLLKKLDMTTFTKKGLIALSKFCGISLITQTDTKKKLNKAVKTIQYSKKQYGKECNDPSGTLTTDSNKNYRIKRKLGKQIAKSKPRIRFKIGKEDTSADEDSLDVICKKHNKALKMRVQSSRNNDKDSETKSVIDSILSDSKENVIPEPCKTCNRSEHPERLHSHPKLFTRFAFQEKTNEKNIKERFEKVSITKDTEESGKEEMKKSQSAKESEIESFQNSTVPCEECEKKVSEEINPSAFNFKSPKQSNSLTEFSSSEAEKKTKSKNVRKSLASSSKSTKPKSDILKKSNSKGGISEKEDEKVTPDEEVMTFITGCYICGKQVSPKLRIKHEKSCILEWRTQNNLISPDKRKTEPKRPDFRFTASGDVDCEGTFQSIWANHIDSLIPCKKCGRKFFPDRIERHENCCNSPPINIKYKP